MFRHRPMNASAPSRAIETLEIIFHVSIRNLRKTHGNAVLGLFMSIVQSILLVITMYVTFDILGLRRIAVRGDFMLYVMSGVFMFMTHVKAVGAVAAAEKSPFFKQANAVSAASMPLRIAR